MRVVKTVSTMQRLALSWRRGGQRIAFVPTMGYLHAGHVSLIRRARQAAGPGGLVVVSIYVNPTQFAAGEDLSRYPRDFRRDHRLCREAGADVIFFPADEQMYPGKKTGDYSTYVVEENLSRGMEGAARPTHFRGVTTVVAKLLHVVLPDVAVFGAKDFQQAAIIRRMTRDLNFPVRIMVTPTVREQDGLAMSSRNKFLNAEERQQATVLWRALQSARAAVKSGPQRANRLKRDLIRLISRESLAKVDYVEFFDPDTLRPVTVAQRGTQMALAVFFGKTRLIDNAPL
jgi:pantoate--beta-alanine ligase